MTNQDAMRVRETPLEMQAHQAIREAMLVELPIDAPDFLTWMQAWEDGEDRSAESAAKMHNAVTDLIWRLNTVERAMWLASRAGALRRRVED